MACSCGCWCIYPTIVPLGVAAAARCAHVASLLALFVAGIHVSRKNTFHWRLSCGRSCLLERE